MQWVGNYLDLIRKILEESFSHSSDEENVGNGAMGTDIEDIPKGYFLSDFLKSGSGDFYVPANSEIDLDQN